jgi:hypothetical protein
MLENISYILFFSVFIIFIIYTYIRLKYGFWVIQPVFHVYDYRYMLNPPGIINHSLPTKNKYTNFKNIETFVFTELSKLKLNKFMNLIDINHSPFVN